GVRPPSRPLWNARLKGRRLNSAAGSPLYTASDKRAMRIPEPVAVTGPRPCVRRRALGIPARRVDPAGDVRRVPRRRLSRRRDVMKREAAEIGVREFVDGISKEDLARAFLMFTIARC